MGCGASKVVQAIEEDPDKAPAPPDTTLQADELTSVRSNTPDEASKPINAPSSGLLINGTEPSAPTLEEHRLPQSPLERKAPPSGGSRAVAFEVGAPADASESLIRRHPPRKFQKLEDQPQGGVITQEKLEEKQAIAERRRQEILTQRVQSAKHRSASRMRTHPDDGDEVEKFMRSEELDWMSMVNTSLLPPVKPAHSAPPAPPSRTLACVSST